MREILFRGQRIDNGEWVYGFYVETLDIKNEDVLPPFEKKKYIFTSWEESLLSNEDNGGIFEIKPESIGQFTGLLDKNGNEIFEGDFVIDNDGNKTIIVWIKEWSMFGCMFLDEFEKYQLNGISELDESMFWTFPIENNLEIIGNIHEENKQTTLIFLRYEKE